jgi:hypothetical protein
MASEKPDRQNTCLILNARNQSVVVSLDVKNDAAALENAGLWIRRLEVVWKLGRWQKGGVWPFCHGVTGLVKLLDIRPHFSYEPRISLP